MQVRLGPQVKDWDAPEEVDPISASLHRSSKRGRSASPMGEPVTSDSEDGDKWNKRLKKPRMTMVADQVGLNNKKEKVIQFHTRNISLFLMTANILHHTLCNARRNFFYY